MNFLYRYRLIIHGFRRMLCFAMLCLNTVTLAILCKAMRAHPQLFLHALVSMLFVYSSLLLSTPNHALQALLQLNKT